MYDSRIDYDIVPMSKRQLALLYSADLTPHAAVNRLMAWIGHNPTLVEQLRATGYRKNARILSPRQVALIMEHLGEP